jgi:hypothetical protein
MVQSNPVAASAEQNGQPVTPTAYVHDDIIVDIFKRFQDPDQSIVPVEDVPQDVSGLHQLIVWCFAYAPTLAAPGESLLGY